jgi:hypothetical protein
MHDYSQESQCIVHCLVQNKIQLDKHILKKLNSKLKLMICKLYKHLMKCIIYNITLKYYNFCIKKLQHQHSLYCKGNLRFHYWMFSNLLSCMNYIQTDQLLCNFDKYNRMLRKSDMCSTQMFLEGKYHYTCKLHLNRSMLN